MPFTLSHPAAVVPIRRYGILSALIVGSLAPDMLYFIPRAHTSSYGHTLPGLFLFCLPMGLAALWIFHRFLKRPVISLFPAAQQQKLLLIATEFKFFPLTRFAKIVASILLGAASHITWDSFTHGSTWLVQEVDWLQAAITITPQLQVRIYDLLQYGGSLLGMLVILYYYFRWLRSTPSTEDSDLAHFLLPPVTRMLLLLTFAAGTVAPAIASLWLNPAYRFHIGRTFLGESAIAGLKMLSVEIILFSIMWHLLYHFRQDDNSEPVAN